MSRNGFVGGLSAGANGAAGGSAGGTFVASGGSTTAQIFSAVDALVVGRGKAAVFNIQHGSAGAVDGYLFVDNGTLTDTIVKFKGDGQNVIAETDTAGMYFHATTAGALDAARTINSLSGGMLFFGANVGVG